MKNKFVLVGFLFIFLVGFVLAEDINSKVALEEINNSKAIIQDMAENNFSTVFVSDLLIEAEKAYSLAYYAEILNNLNSSAEEVSKAKGALSLMNYKKINYSDVLVYTNQIKERQQEAFRISDLISLYSSNLAGAKGFSSQDLASLNFTLENARVAFYDERYSEANSSLYDFSVSFESLLGRNVSLAGFKTGVQTFFQKYWIALLISFLVLILIFYFVYSKHRVSSLKKKIHLMKIQEISLNQLIKEAQVDRFKKNSISDLVYKLRVKKYEDLLTSIKQELPVLESNLQKLRKGK